ncbi:MAG: type I glyceraldehyde-3-phosphate dehydrogenase [Planctomycetota bacterium]
MSIRVAIMGFGRIGRNVFRAIYGRDDMEVVAISDLADPKAMEYLLRFDSLFGQFPEPVQFMDGYLFAKGRRIPVLQGREPGDVPWFDYGVDICVEATGRYRTRAELQKHLDAGADRVILTVPPRDQLDATYIKGFKSKPLSREHRIISCGSSTSNCTALMLKVLNDNFPVEEAVFTSVHAYTTEQSLIDTPSKIDLRLSRAAVENIVPVKSWTENAIQDLFPHLQGRFAGSKLNVPVPDVSCVDLVTFHKQDVRKEDVNAVFRSAAQSTLKDVMDYADAPIVSSDVAGSAKSVTFDSLATMECGQTMVKTLGWYDQGGGLSHRIVDAIRELMPHQGQEASR